jgi:hypothetical protein
MAARKIPSAICDWLNQSDESPVQNLIKRASTPESERKKAVITDTSVVKMIEESLSSPSGCLFPYRNIASGETDFDGICKVLVAFWTSVREVFPDAWGKPPAKSRLIGGVGIRAMGRLMDRIMPGIKLENKNAVNQIKKEIGRIADVCRWTSGRWEDLDGLKWNELQNVPRHVHVLSNYLIRTYTQSWSRE